MTHIGHDFPQRVFTAISKAVSTFLLLALFYVLQYIFDLEFLCSCRAGIHWPGLLYLLLPPWIIASLIILIESVYQRLIRSRCCRHYCFSNFSASIFVKFVIKYSYLCIVWIAAVFMDGDWYFCLRTNLNATQVGMPCKRNLSYADELIKNDYKTTSLVSDSTQ